MFRSSAMVAKILLRRNVGSKLQLPTAQTIICPSYKLSSPYPSRTFTSTGCIFFIGCVTGAGLTLLASNTYNTYKTRKPEAAPSKVSIAERNAYFATAELAEYLARYNEMASLMKSVAMMPFPLSRKDRETLHTAFHRATKSRRDNIHMIDNQLRRPTVRQDGAAYAACIGFKSYLEGQIETICKDMVMLLDSHLIPNSCGDTEAQIFYFKLKGDFSRYRAKLSSLEKAPGSFDRLEIPKQALDSYETATELASKSLPATHPLRLELALNFAIFYYGVLGKPELACQIAKEAIDNAAMAMMATTMTGASHILKIGVESSVHGKGTTNTQQGDDAAARRLLNHLEERLTLWTNIINEVGDTREPK